MLDVAIGRFLLTRHGHVVTAAWRPGGAAPVAAAVRGWVSRDVATI
jgi:hypothetical protein